MKKSKFQISLEKDLKTQTIKLYKQGLTMREVAEKVGKSRMWVCRIVNENIKDPFGDVDK